MKFSDYITETENLSEETKEKQMNELRSLLREMREWKAKIKSYNLSNIAGVRGSVDSVIANLIDILERSSNNY